MRMRAQSPDLHHRPIPAPAHDSTRLRPKRDLPHVIARLAQLSHEIPRLRLVQLHVPVAAARDEVLLVQLQGGDGGPVGRESVEHFVGGEGEGDDPPVGPAGGEDAWGEVDLADEGGVALQECHALSEWLR